MLYGRYSIEYRGIWTKELDDGNLIQVPYQKQRSRTQSADHTMPYEPQQALQPLMGCRAQDDCVGIIQEGRHHDYTGMR